MSESYVLLDGEPVGVCVRRQSLGNGDGGKRRSERTRKFINLFAVDVIGTELHLRCPKYALE